MTLMKAVLGLMLFSIAIWDAFEVVILPRRVTHRFRLAQLCSRSTWRLWSAVAQWVQPDKRRETYLSIFGPLLLLMLLSVWATGMIAGFAMMHWGCRHPTERIDRDCTLSQLSLSKRHDLLHPWPG